MANNISKEKETTESPEFSLRVNMESSGSRLKVVLLATLVVAVFSSVIITLDRKNQIYNDISEAKSKLSTLESENVRMRSELDARISLKNVEEYAEQVLGMQKIDNSQIKYIQIQTNDIVSIPVKDDGMLTKLKKFVNKCLEYFKG